MVKPITKLKAFIKLLNNIKIYLIKLRKVKTMHKVNVI